MSLGCNAGLQSKLDGTKYRLLIMMQHQSQDLGHLPVAARPLEHQPLQLPERFRHLGERRLIAQGTGLALDDRQIVPPVIDCSPSQVMGTLDDPGMSAQELAFGHNDDLVRVNPQAHSLVREGGWHTVTCALKVYEARRRYTLGMFDEAVEGLPGRHQTGDFTGMHIGDSAGQSAVQNLAPLFDAVMLKPDVERINVREVGIGCHSRRRAF